MRKYFNICQKEEFFYIFLTFLNFKFFPMCWSLTCWLWTCIAIPLPFPLRIFSRVAWTSKHKFRPPHAFKGLIISWWAWWRGYSQPCRRRTNKWNKTQKKIKEEGRTRKEKVNHNKTKIIQNSFFWKNHIIP